MSQVKGKPIDSGFDFLHENLYGLLVTYYNNPIFTKIKNERNYSLYMCKIHAILGIEYRYLVAFTYKDENALLAKESLSNLKWVSFQCRTLRDEHNMESHGYIPQRLFDLDKKITLKNKTENSYEYSVEELPIKITLLPKNNKTDYSSQGTVVTALETYMTILSWV